MSAFSSSCRRGGSDGVAEAEGRAGEGCVVRLPGRGKSGGARVIYLHLERHDTIVFFYVYTKAKSENLTPDQLKRLRSAVAVIKQEFKP